MGEESGAESPGKSAWQLRVKEKPSMLRSSLRESDRMIQELRGMFESQPVAEILGEDTYRQAAAQWRSCLDPILQTVDDLLLWKNDRQAGRESSSRGTGTGNRYGGHASFREFLQGLNEDADEIPSNEAETLYYSLKYYREAFEASRSGVGSNQKIQLAYMVGELSRRVGEFTQAREYFGVAIRTGHELIHQFRHDESKTALARKIVEMASEQSRLCKDAQRDVAR
jgi:hypothetical protein